MTRWPATLRLVAVTGLVLVVGTGLTPPASADEPLALEVLESITIEEENSPGYERTEDYAPSGWTDAAGDGCTTREEVLARDLDAAEIGADGCTVEYGEVIDAYTGERIAHIQGESQVEIEHVVAVEEADRSGAHALDEQAREDFYQDQENLLAIGGSENGAKGSDDPADYMPPNDGVRCTYVAAVVYVKDKYELTMDSAEHAHSSGVLSDEACATTAAAPAQAMYTEDWDEADRSLTDLIAEHPLVSAIVALGILLTIIVLCGSPRARRWVVRSGSRWARRTTRRVIRSTLRR